MNRWTVMAGRAVLVAAIVCAIGWTGALDVEHELAQEQHYCEMVAAGHWPDYDDAIDCTRVVR